LFWYVSEFCGPTGERFSSFETPSIKYYPLICGALRTTCITVTDASLLFGLPIQLILVPTTDDSSVSISGGGADNYRLDLPWTASSMGLTLVGSSPGTSL